MSAPRRMRITTPNLAEVGYLLGLGHVIEDAAVVASPPYGVEAVCVTMEGLDIELDRRLYLMGHTGIGAAELRRACDEVVTMMEQREEAALREDRP